MSRRKLASTLFGFRSVAPPFSPTFSGFRMICNYVSMQTLHIENDTSEVKKMRFVYVIEMCFFINQSNIERTPVITPPLLPSTFLATRPSQPNPLTQAQVIL